MTKKMNMAVIAKISITRIYLQVRISVVILILQL